jgi:hypothetical protein
MRTEPRGIRLSRLSVLLVAVTCAPRAASPQGGEPLGTEFRVNTYTTLNQVYPSVATDSAGNFVVVWHSQYQDGDGSFGIFGQRFSSSGMPLGSEFRVNTYTTNSQLYPSIASDPSGDFVVTWQSAAQDGSSFGIFGQRFANSGMPVGPEFRVNSFTSGYQQDPSVAMEPGTFVVVWNDQSQDGSGAGIFGQRYAASGAPLGPEFRVNSHTTDLQADPSVVAAAGHFVVVWHSRNQDGSTWGVFGQRYDITGTPLGDEFRVNTSTSDAQTFPTVASDAESNFVVTWASGGLYGGNPPSDVFGQRYSTTGEPLGSEFRVNTYTTDRQFAAAIASDPTGDFVIVWHSLEQDGSFGGIFGQRYAGSGEPLGPEFRVNSHTPTSQYAPAVTADSSGNFVVIWQSAFDQDGSEGGVFGQRFGRIVPVELMRFRVE